MARSLMLASAIFVGIQCILLVILMFGDFGFDKAGRYGFDIEDHIMFMALYLLALISGLVFAARKRKWKTFALQVVLPLALSFVALTMSPRMRPPLDAAEYQHLVGKTRDQVHKTLHYRQHTSGSITDEMGERDIESYKGVTIYYEPDPRRSTHVKVLSVESNQIRN